ncbi:hypothetical protein [Paenibacillus turpanensis]|uniref:hypothetical protein n=1 Tax=Paenibacillus turpanensis TaxID=2689078 RepID=UPI0014077C3A|nr:hypothetical protein [Paenibacillus turpanensis]
MFRLPLCFIATGIAGFLLHQAVSFFTLSSWLVNHPRSPETWTQAHLLILGWATMIAMGAVYQLLHVVLQRHVFSERLGFVHYALFTLGTAGMLINYRLGAVMPLAFFASLTFSGIMVFAVNIGITLLRARLWNSVTISACGAVLCLVLTGATGLAMGLNLAFTWAPDYHSALFGAHLWLGMVGWFGLLITGFSYKMLPMFYLSHGYPVRFEIAATSLWFAAVVAGAAGNLLQLSRYVQSAALLLLTVSLLCYLAHMRLIYKRKHKFPGSGIAFTIASAACLAFGAAVWTGWSFYAPEAAVSPEGMLAAGWFYLWGWVGFTILGYMSKIVPFLWWTRKYGNLVGKQKTPSMADLLNDRHVKHSLIAIAGALIVALAGLVGEWPAVSALGGTLLAAGCFVYMTLIVNVFRK